MEVRAAVVPYEHDDPADDARAPDRAPEAAVAGDRPVVAHHVELPGRDAKWVLPGGAGYRGPERIMWRQVRLAEPPAVDEQEAACGVDGLARQRDDALDEVGPGRTGTMVARWVGEHDDVALAQLVPVEERLQHQDPVMDVKRRHHGGGGDREGLERERPDAERQHQRQRQATGPSGEGAAPRR